MPPETLPPNPRLADALLWLRARLLAALPLFTTGYAPAYRLEGRVLIRQGADLLPLQLADHHGAQFYYRLNGPVRYTPLPQPLGSGATALRLSAPVRLVALLPGADPLAAEDALRRVHLQLEAHLPPALRLVPTAAETEAGRVWRQEFGPPDRPLPAPLLTAALLALDLDLLLQTAAPLPNPTLCPPTPCRHDPLDTLLCPTP